MKNAMTLLLTILVLGACTTTTDGPRVGQVQICESRKPRDPSSGDNEEIPEYDFCRCETIGL
jgi:hypothetical protein